MTDPLPEYRGVYYDEHRRGLEEECSMKPGRKLNTAEARELVNRQFGDAFAKLAEEHQPDDDGALWAAVGIVLVALAVVVAVLVSV